MDKDRIRKLGTREGFIELFYQEKGTERTCKEAFERVNEEYERLFGEPRYSDYNSFRNSRDRSR